MPGTTLGVNVQALRDGRPSPGHCGQWLKGAKATVLLSFKPLCNIGDGRITGASLTYNPVVIFKQIKLVKHE